MTTAGKNFSNFAWWAVLALAALLPSRLAAVPAITSAVDAQQFFVGDGFLWTLTVSGAKQSAAPEVPALPDFFQHALEPQIVEMGEVRVFVYRCRLIPRRAGLLTLPPATVTADGEELSTEPQGLLVGEPQATRSLRLEVFLDRREVFVGQPVALTFRLMSALSLSSLMAMDIQMPVLYHPDFDVVVPAAERTAGGQPDTIGLPVEGQRVIGALSSVTINGESFDVISFRRILVPHTPGSYRFDPVRLLCSSATQNAERRSIQPRYPSYFNNDFFQEADGAQPYVRYGARSDSFSLTVRPLPENNRPVGFSGIVGQGGIESSADPQTLVIGEPVTLTVRLSGFDFPEVLTLPPLEKLADVAGQFLVPDQQSPARVLNHDAVFVQSLRPLRTAVTQVPKLEVVIFNPDRSQYETLTTPPIPLRIQPDGDITAIDLGADTPSSHTVNPAGIWHNLSADAVDPLSRAGRWIKMTWYGWLLLPPVLFLALEGPARMHRLKRSEPVRWRRLTAFARLRRSLHRAASPEARRAAAVVYLGTRLDIREAALSEQEVLRALRGRHIEPDPTTRDFLRTLFDFADRARFGRVENTGVAAPGQRDMLAALAKLERSLNL